MFGISRSSPSSTIRPMVEGLVARAVVTIPAGRRRYFERLADLRTNVFVPERLTNRVHELSRRIRPTLAAYDEGWARDHDFHVAYLCERIVQRAQSVSEQLAEPHEPIPFDADGVAPLADWSPYVSRRQADDWQFRQAEHDGRRVLQIANGGEPGAGSWRTRILMGPGRYRFEGRVMTSGVGASGGASLRTSWMGRQSATASEGAWAVLTCPLVIDDPLAEVELVCELQSGIAEAWFDEKSLRLVRE
jgi:hypothetical protein